MMDAKKCDRCGTFYQPEVWKHGDIVVKKKRQETDGIIFPNTWFVDDDIDLCPGCRPYIKDWLTKKEKEN